MAERVADYEWRGEGEDAEIVLYAADDSAFARALPAAGLPGVESPVYAVASESGFGWAVASSSHAAPDLVSIPARGVLITTDMKVNDLGMPSESVSPLIFRNLAEMSLPRLNAAGVRRVCELGARAAAEDGLIEEDDLTFFRLEDGAADALGRRSITAGERDWERRLGELKVQVVTEVFDSEGAGSLGLELGVLAVVIRAGAESLGRLALSTHRERILRKVWGSDFGARAELPAAPAGSEEADDLLAAVAAAANFADGRTALFIHALRRASRDIAGRLDVLAGWAVGGVELRDGLLVHRDGLAAVGEGEVLVAGGSIASGTGKMWESAPPFGIVEDEGRWPWEEAELSKRLAKLGRLGG